MAKNDTPSREAISVPTRVVVSLMRLAHGMPYCEICEHFNMGRPGARLSPQRGPAEKKEEQRLRRVIANRESACKTSLRRKALHADLEKKVAELKTENENLKKEKYLWTEKYQTLLEK
ncbi:ABSCISIC ACID-INSENSITIVE 5-like protein 2 [Brachypodium distachyon]|uniref:ABSCISIC ACID-INSENSITIVE 5-like protein 2 n=1 Tax=Brachypodium distachyon TaxID=15368 RepID=UPI000D0CB4FD|nr:ABSCISIC ACID-INSENSITIVE 5-like protein 2 [Brachypodium distachyon]|eukprot:XP_024310383.1 ABSCISIC ACID-INSENSITIVE 5-like protein 2 [Brachypodium distachyon]